MPSRVTRAPAVLSPGRIPSVRARGAAPILALALLAATAPISGAVTPRVHAIVGARIVTAPGQVIPRGTIVIRDGVITAVGAGVAVPADARVWKADSLTIYPGLIDAYVPLPEAQSRPEGPAAAWRGRQTPAEANATRGASNALASVTPEVRVTSQLPLAVDLRESLRRSGFTVVHVVPRVGVFRGQSAVVSLGDGGANRVVTKTDAAQIVAIEPWRGGYPASLMGAIAVIRQTFLDARWYRDARTAYAKDPKIERPETNLSWEALQAPVARLQPVWFVASDMLEVLRATALAKEANVDYVTVGGGDEYKRINEIAATRAPLVIPVTFPEAPDVSDPDQALEVTTEELRAWDQAPGNLAIVAKHGVPFAVTANGLKDPGTLRANMAKAIRRGLDATNALASLTTEPARLLGLGDRLGTIAPGRIANLTVVRGELFSDDGVVREVWVDGDRYETTKDATSPKGRWAMPSDRGVDTLLVATDKDTTVRVLVGADTLKATNVRIEEQRLRFTVEDPRIGGRWDTDVTAANDALTGVSTSAGKKVPVEGRLIPEKPKEKPKPDVPVESPAVMGNTEAWRMPPPAQPAAVLVRHATIWTAGPKGILTDADLLVKGGKIAAVGKGLSAPGNAVVIDGSGKSVSPGVIDEHSHAAILGDVNECTNNITCEVRIRDVVNSENPNIYRQLAGGTTIMHLLHGSCNSIGGQCQAIKNKWGAPPDQLIIENMPGTVKFALGENPKQSNWGPDATDRYPKSRAGVEQSIRDAFLKGRDYQAKWAAWSKGHQGLPPRRDLQLDAIAEILDGKRLIHCHSYRQDEILMLMRLTESFGIRVNTFTHVLEGYKVADEIATHGASALGFTDWWGYKYEVIDAIPWNQYLMWDRGVNVGFNSDDPELARRLNSEAGKAMKYGGVPPEEAIKFVTLNPAKSLKIDDRVGSLEPGKDADFVIWSGPPMSPTSACLETWIEGRKYFDRAADLAGRAALEKEREQLLAKAKGAKKEPNAGGGKWPPRYLEDTALDGNACGSEDGVHRDLPFMGEAEREALQSGGVER
jgi:imidazolonepropionase-like amidohydrolase